MVMTDSSPGTRVGSSPSSRAGGGAASGRRLRYSGYLWILPAMVLSVGLIYYCIIYTGYISTLDWNGSSPVQTSVGLQNYLDILQDPIFWGAILHTVIYFVGTFVVQTTLGLVFAVLLHSRVRLKSVYKVIIFVPVVLAPAVMAPVFRQAFSADGQFNGLLEAIGLGFLRHAWLAEADTALPTILAITIWGSTGLTFILYFAAMGQIDADVLDAARLDGAGNIRTLVSIILPEVQGTTVALLILTAIGSLKLFDVPFLVTAGGPNYATEFLGTYIYRTSIQQGHVGYAAALSVMLLILAVSIAILLSRRNRPTSEAV